MKNYLFITTTISLLIFCGCSVQQTPQQVPPPQQQVQPVEQPTPEIKNIEIRLDGLIRDRYIERYYIEPVPRHGPHTPPKVYIYPNPHHPRPEINIELEKMNKNGPKFSFELHG